LLIAIPASSVPSEAAFLTVTCIIDDYRSRLNAETVEALMICKSWVLFTKDFSNVPRTKYTFPAARSQSSIFTTTEEELA
jgi:hypothetical protein